MKPELQLSHASISDCGAYRYCLIRAWDRTIPPAVFVMLNPSTADAQTDDPTIRRCTGYARDWGWGGLMVLNLYALRATDPRELWKHEDPVGPDNGGWLELLPYLDTGPVVCAWGSHGARNGRAREVLAQLAGRVELHALRVGRTGQPAHPLYLPKDLRPQPYAPQG